MGHEHAQVTHHWRHVVIADGNVDLEGHGGGVDKAAVQTIAVGPDRIVAVADVARERSEAVTEA